MTQTQTRLADGSKKGIHAQFSTGRICRQIIGTLLQPYLESRVNPIDHNTLVPNLTLSIEPNGPIWLISSVGDMGLSRASKLESTSLSLQCRGRDLHQQQAIGPDPDPEQLDLMADPAQTLLSIEHVVGILSRVRKQVLIILGLCFGPNIGLKLGCAGNV